MSLLKLEYVRFLIFLISNKCLFLFNAQSRKQKKKHPHLGEATQERRTSSLPQLLQLRGNSRRHSYIQSLRLRLRLPRSGAIHSRLPRLVDPASRKRKGRHHPGATTTLLAVPGVSTDDDGASLAGTLETAC